MVVSYSHNQQTTTIWVAKPPTVPKWLVHIRQRFLVLQSSQGYRGPTGRITTIWMITAVHHWDHPTVNQNDPMVNDMDHSCEPSILSLAANVNPRNIRPAWDRSPKRAYQCSPAGHIWWHAAMIEAFTYSGVTMAYRRVGYGPVHPSRVPIYRPNGK